MKQLIRSLNDHQWLKFNFLQVLSMQQLYRISTMYWDDKYSTQSLSPDVSFYHVYYLLVLLPSNICISLNNYIFEAL